MKAFEVHQSQKIQAHNKQISESKNIAEKLTKEVERLQREIALKEREFKEQSERPPAEVDSVNRLVSLSDKLRGDLQRLKNENHVLKENERETKAKLVSDKRRHQQELKRMLTVVQKRSNCLDLARKQGDLLTTDTVFKYSQDEFRQYFQSNDRIG